VGHPTRVAHHFKQDIKMKEKKKKTDSERIFETVVESLCSNCEKYNHERIYNNILFAWEEYEKNSDKDRLVEGIRKIIGTDRKEME
jgi:hypothetical protein